MVAPESTDDRELASGADIIIEERAGDEVRALRAAVYPDPRARARRALRNHPPPTGEANIQASIGGASW